MKYTLFLSCISGFEHYCQNEVENLDIKNITSLDGGVQFKGDLEDIYKINYSSRHGMHLYWEIADLEFSDSKLYKNIYNMCWDQYLNNIQSFAVKVNSTNRRLNTQYTALVIKDGIVDYFNKKYGNRPNVDKKNPDIPIYAFVNNDRIKIYINTTGEPLYKRGYRTSNMHDAPLNEVLAANINAAVKSKNNILYDPMCGSGTLLIESAMENANIPSQICRNKFSFMNWFNYDSDLYTKIKDIQRNNILNNTISYFGSDIDDLSLRMVEGSIEKLNLKHSFTIRKRNFYEFIPKPNSTIIFNPPYDVRISTNKKISEFYENIGNKLKDNCNSSTIFIFTIESDNLKYINIPCLKSIQFKNGNLNCVLNKYKI